MQHGDNLPDAAYAATLAGLVSMTPQRLQRLLRGRSAQEVSADLRAPRARLTSRLMGAEQVPTRGGLRTAQIVDGWRRAAIEADPALVWEHLVATGTTVCHRGLSGYPARLVDDRAAPEILFTRGSIAQLDGPDTARRRRRWGSRRRLPREQQSALGSPRGRRGHPLRSGTRNGTGKVALSPSEPAHCRACPCRGCRRVPQGGRGAAHRDGRGRTQCDGSRGSRIGEEPRVRRHQLPH